MEYTKEQIIQFTINILSEVNVPATKASEVGVPIESAIKNLLVVQNMIEIEKTKQEIQNDPETNIVGGEKDGQSNHE